MYQPKVKHTETYNDHVVCKGKLKLIIDIKEQLKRDSNSLGLGESLGKATAYKPIIISESESIEIDDKYYWHGADVIRVAHPDGHRNKHECNKILALPEHFSEEQLQDIGDGKFKDENEVFIKCEWAGFYNDMNNYYRVQLNSQNHITLFPAKQFLEEAVEEHVKFFHPYLENIHERKESFIAGAEWAKKNNY